MMADSFPELHEAKLMWKLSVRRHGFGYAEEVWCKYYRQLENAKRYRGLNWEDPIVAGGGYYARDTEYVYYIWPIVFEDSPREA